MKKQHLVKLSIAAGAVFGALSGNASADATVFGIADAGFGNFKAAGATSSKTSMISGGMTTSAFGIKGGEDLGSGLKADYAMSAFISLADGSNLSGLNVQTPLFTREAWLGVGGDFGHISLGRDVNPAFIPVIAFNAYGDSTVYSPLWNATFFNSKTGSTGTAGLDSAAKGLYSDTAWDGQVRYTSPNLGGAVVDVMYSPNSAGNNVGANVMYFNGPVGLSAFYMDTKSLPSGSLETNIFTANESAKTYFVGGSYDFGVAKTFATYQEGKQSATGLKAKTWHLSSSIPAGPGKVLVSYAHTKTTDSVETIYKQAAIGYDYPLSKKIDLYVNYLRAQESGLSNGHVYGGGMRYFF